MKTIIFDLGGVLIDWNPRYLFRSYFQGREDEMEYFLTHVCNQEWNEKQDAGRSFADGQKEVAEKFPQFKTEIEAYFKNWPQTLGQPIEGTVEILEGLAADKKYRLLALSNWSGETFHFARAKFPFLRIFEAILVSGDERLIKPDARFFNLLVERHGVVPKESVFIDDVDRNIVAAQKLGYQTIHFKNPEQLGLSLGPMLNQK